jgi:hypothetical protein
LAQFVFGEHWVRSPLHKFSAQLAPAPVGACPVARLLHAKTTKANPFLTCGEDRLSMSHTLTSNLDYLLRCERRWRNIEYWRMLVMVIVSQFESKSNG